MTAYQNASNKPTAFNTKRVDLISNLANKISPTPKMYATGSLEVDGSIKLYGSAKCTRDLASYDCRKCLDGAILCFLNIVNGNKVLGFIYTESCSIRYEIYKLF